MILPVQAHPLLGSFIQHRIALQRHSPHLEVIVELTFFEEPSFLERTRMDANHDGRISRAELEAYARDLEKPTAAAIKLLVAGREVTLAPLYTPEVDLLGTSGVVAAHHELRLHLFGSVSNLPPAGAEIVVEDHLWPSAPALVTLSDSPGHRMQWERTRVEQKLKPATAGEVRRFKARLVGDEPPLQSPTAGDAKPSANSSSQISKP